MKFLTIMLVALNIALLTSCEHKSGKRVPEIKKEVAVIFGDVYNPFAEYVKVILLVIVVLSIVLLVLSVIFIPILCHIT